MNHARCWIGLLMLLCGSAAQAAAVATPGSSWLAEAQRELALREYRASTNEVGLQAPNREHFRVLRRVVSTRKVGVQQFQQFSPSVRGR